MLGRLLVPAFLLGLTSSHLGKSHVWWMVWFGTLNFWLELLNYLIIISFGEVFVGCFRNLIPRNIKFKNIESPSQSTNELSDAQVNLLVK